MLVQHLEGLGPRLSGRKFRVFAAAACRIWHLLDDTDRVVVEPAERFADGEVSEEYLAVVRRPTGQLGVGASLSSLAAEGATWEFGADAARAPAVAVREAIYRTTSGEAVEAEEAALERLLDDVAGPVPAGLTEAALASWRSANGGAALRIAGVIYAERRFEDMPALTDALEEAGCDNAEILAHCRGPGPHARGCFVLDALLGRS